MVWSHPMRRFLKASVWVALIGVLSVNLAEAHSLRIIVSSTHGKPGTPATAYLSWGHGLPVDELYNGSNLARYELLAGTQVVESWNVEGLGLHEQALKLKDPGIYQVRLVTKPVIFSTFRGPDNKNGFVRGGRDAVPQGAKDVKVIKSVTFAKAVVTRGDVEDEAIPALGDDFEIVPITKTEHGAFCMEAPITFQVRLRGAPVAGVKVSAAHTGLNSDGSPALTEQTDAQGLVKLKLDDPGTWVLEAYYEAPASAESQGSYDVESFSAALTLGVTEHDHDH